METLFGSELWCQTPKFTLAEQEAIVEALSDADALIESLEQLIAKKRQIKPGAMQELLTGNKPLSPPAAPVQGRLQNPPAKRKLLAVRGT
jgi:hypothetical protein